MRTNHCKIEDYEVAGGLCPDLPVAIAQQRWLLIMTMTIPNADAQSILAQGGKLSAPENVPHATAREFVRLWAIFVDSEVGGACGFARGLIQRRPRRVGTAHRSARIVLEKGI